MSSHPASARTLVRLCAILALLLSAAPLSAQRTAPRAAPAPDATTPPLGGRGRDSASSVARTGAAGGSVLTATGAVPSRELGAAARVIERSSVERAGAHDIEDVLAGQGVGATVVANTGAPGAAGMIRLRGINSVIRASAPLIYVDGVLVDNERTLPILSSDQTLAAWTDIEPEEIERVEVVSGPAGSALYGSGASGGVIQIFTRTGDVGPPRWSAEVSAGANSVGHVGPASDVTGLFMNQCRGEKLVNGAGQRFEDPTCPASGSWLRNGLVQRYALGVRGGTGWARYALSGNFADERGVLPGEGSRDGGARANIAFTPLPSLRLSLTSAIARRTLRWAPSGNYIFGALAAISSGPDSPFEGSGCTDPGAVCVANGRLFAGSPTATSNHVTLGASVDFSPFARFTNRLAVGYDDNRTEASEIDELPPDYSTTVSRQQRRHRYLLTADYSSRVRQPIGKTLVATTSVGAQLLSGTTNREMYSIQTTDSLSAFDGEIRRLGSNLGLFAQERVAWRERLFVAGGARVDGVGGRYGQETYPTASLAYIISRERFWPTRILPRLELRAAFGAAGNALGVVNSPERTRETEVGFDAAALGERLGVSYTHYAQRTADAYIPVMPPPSPAGPGPYLERAGDVRSHGSELELTARLLASEAVDWSARVQYTTVRSTVRLPGGTPIVAGWATGTSMREGYPAPSFFGSKVMNPNAYADPIIQDNVYLGPASPSAIISPATTLRLGRRLSLDLLGEFQRGGYLFNWVGAINAANGTWQPCYAVQEKLRAAANGDPSALATVTALQRARCGNVEAENPRTFWVERNDFFRLRSASLSYDLPARLLPALRSATITLSAQNLYSSMDYTGVEPEAATQADGSFSRRDLYVMPAYRTILVSVHTTF